MKCDKCGADTLQPEARRIDIEEAEARCCPEDVGFEEWIGVLTKRLHWAEAELIEIMRLVSKGLYGDSKEDEITDYLRLHGIRLLVVADAEHYEALLKRVQERRAMNEGSS